MTGDYRKELIASTNYLVQVRHNLFGEAMNLTMQGDLGHINDAFEVMDTYTLEPAHLKDSADSNVNKLVSLIEANPVGGSSFCKMYPSALRF